MQMGAAWGRECPSSKVWALDEKCKHGTKSLNPRVLGKQHPDASLQNALAFTGLWKASQSMQAGRALQYHLVGSSIPQSDVRFLYLSLLFSQNNNKKKWSQQDWKLLWGNTRTVFFIALTEQKSLALQKLCKAKTNFHLDRPVFFSYLFSDFCILLLCFRIETSNNIDTFCCTETLESFCSIPPFSA